MDLKLALRFLEDGFALPNSSSSTSESPGLKAHTQQGKLPEEDPLHFPGTALLSLRDLNGQVGINSCYRDMRRILPENLIEQIMGRGFYSSSGCLWAGGMHGICIGITFDDRKRRMCACCLFMPVSHKSRCAAHRS